MEIRSFVPQGPATNAEVAAPPDLVALVAEHEKRMRPELDAARGRAEPLRQRATLLEREATALSGEAKKQKLNEAQRLLGEADKIEGRGRELFDTDVLRVSGDAGRDLLLADETYAYDDSDAAHAVPAATNATLWLTSFGYGTHRPMEAWLRDVPADKKVKVSVICTPSGHVGSTEAEREKNYERFARQNQYVVEVVHRAPNGKETAVQRVQFGIKKAPEYATLSPELTLDLDALKGTIIVRGWPIGSGATGGYIEQRETLIHNP